MHLLFEQAAAVRVAAGYAILICLYPFEQPPIAFNLCAVLRRLLSRALLLPLERRHARLYIDAVRQTIKAAATFRLEMELFEMDNSGRCILEQRLIVGYIEHGQRRMEQKLCQVLQRFDVDVVRRLVQHQQIRPACKHGKEL